MIFASVLKLGVEYTEDQAYFLVNSLLKHNPDARLTLLTDSQRIDHPNIDVIPLTHNWQGWWSKIELFKPGQFDDYVFYMDLDTVIVDNLDFVSEKPLKSFAMLADVYHPGSFGSGIMMWNGKDKDYEAIFETFLVNPDRFMKEYRVAGKWGDQAFIKDCLEEHVIATDMIFPKKFLSYKVHCHKIVPKGTAIVYFHGKPRPWNVKLRMQ